MFDPGWKGPCARGPEDAGTLDGGADPSGVIHRLSAPPPILHGPLHVLMYQITVYQMLQCIIGILTTHASTNSSSSTYMAGTCFCSSCDSVSDFLLRGK